MNNFRYKLIQFLSGRYGVDALSYLMLSVAGALAIINIFLRSLYIQIIVYAIIIIALLRAMSRNKTARTRENDAVLFFFKKIARHRRVMAQRKLDKTHIYKKCPYCKATLRLPRIKGKHKTVCPSCNTEFSVRVYK